MKIRQLSIAQAEYLAHAMVRELMDSDEPIPPFETRSVGKLESCLAEPFQSFDGQMLHRSFVKRAAVLFYLVTKNHAFENGNKRMAVALTLTFCFTNKRWINIEPKKLYELACTVAESDAKSRERVQQVIEDIFAANLTTFDTRRR